MYKLVNTGLLLPGDIILHPLYRKDGLVLVNRYKRITESVLRHILTHCDHNIPMLVVNSSADFERFQIEQMYAFPEFLETLKQVVEAQRNMLQLTLTIEMFADDRAVRRTVQSSMEEKTKEVVLETSSNQAAALNSLFSNPLWINLGSIFESVRLQKRANEVKHLIRKYLETDPVLVKLFEQMRTYHDALFTHSLNTTSVSLAIGLTLELSVQETAQLAIATLFADIGYISVKTADFVHYLNHNLSSNDIRSHVRSSIELISESDIGRERFIIMGILDHHEQCNSQGYPLSKKIHEISLFGRIIAISQAYDTLVGGYLEEKSMPVLEAQAFMWMNQDGKWDKDILSAFFYRQRYCKVGQQVILQNNRVGTIIGFTDFTQFPLHPRVIFDDDEVIDFYLLQNLASIHSIVREQDGGVS